MARRILLSLCIASLVVLTASPASALVRVGVKGGINIATLGSLEDDDIKVNSETDAVGGVFVRFGLSKMLLQVEGLYSKRSTSLVGDEGSLKLTQDFIEVPVLLHYALLRGLISPKIYAGASASFESSCKVDAEGDVEGDCSGLLGADTSTAYWAGVVGGVLDVNLTAVGLFADVRYNYGFTNITTDSRGKWRYWSLMVGLSIGLGT